MNECVLAAAAQVRLSCLMVSLCGSESSLNALARWQTGHNQQRQTCSLDNQSHLTRNSKDRGKLHIIYSSLRLHTEVLQIPLNKATSQNRVEKQQKQPERDGLSFQDSL